MYIDWFSYVNIFYLNKTTFFQYKIIGLIQASFLFRLKNNVYMKKNNNIYLNLCFYICTSNAEAKAKTFQRKF